jgi:pilus assembly protein Flp/PilA
MLHRARTIAIRLWKDEGGASLLEYSLLIGIVAAVTVTAIAAVATWVSGRWGSLATSLGLS